MLNSTLHTDSEHLTSGGGCLGSDAQIICVRARDGVATWPVISNVAAPRQSSYRRRQRLGLIQITIEVLPLDLIYRRRQRLGLIQITIEVLPLDLIAAAQRLGLLTGTAADDLRGTRNDALPRRDLAQIVMHILHEKK
jgi:hypothetical protein